MERRRRDLARDVLMGDDDEDEHEIRRGIPEAFQNFMNYIESVETQG